MGLDMYASCVNASDLEGLSDVDFDIGENSNIKAQYIKYWRKHHDLHGFMHELYIAKGGKDPEFNCVNLRLNEEDLKLLKKTILVKALPETTGFFFGDNPPDADSNKEDLLWVKDCLKLIADNQAIVYSAWF